jgi:Tfp pilus assembly protein PilV
MRNPSTMLALLALPAISALAAIPAQAGYDYPVCLRVYGPATYNECAYTTLAQCQATASGRAAECYPNASYAAIAPPGRRHRHTGAY